MRQSYNLVDHDETLVFGQGSLLPESPKRERVDVRGMNICWPENQKSVPNLRGKQQLSGRMCRSGPQPWPPTMQLGL